MLTISRHYVLIYLVVVFILGAVWHLILFKKLYASFGNFDALEKPRFEFGILCMIAQGIAFGMLYGQVVAKQLSQHQFMLIVFLILLSFIAFAEVGKHTVRRLPLFLFVSVIYCSIQTILVCIAFDQLPCRIGIPNCD